MRHFLMAGAGIGVLLWAWSAGAHAFLKTASPAVGSSVQQAPAQVQIVFTEGVEPLFSGITVTDRGGVRVDHGAAHLGSDAARLVVDVGPMAPGVYRVRWHVTSTDTHKTQGDYSFTVGR